VLTPVKGDFTVQVKVAADFNPGTIPADGFNRAFHSAGLLLWRDELNYFRFERGELIWPDSGAHLYFAPTLQLRLAGRYIEQLGPPSRSRPVFTEPATWFRVQRRTNKLTAWYSRVGEQWQIAREFEAFGAGEIHVGICAVNTAARELNVTFEEFKVTKEP
jgi:regulation of enolase protein 1 (concanavalin A-like superfamily)